MENKKSRLAGAAKHPNKRSNCTPNNPPNKHEMALIDLLEAGTTGISKLTEFPSYGETSLPTTISELGLMRGLKISRERREHIHRHGGKTYFTWYWLRDRGEAIRALQLANTFRKLRGETEITKATGEHLIGRFPPTSTDGGAA